MDLHTDDDENLVGAERGRVPQAAERGSGPRVLRERYFNDIVCLLVHAPTALPPDPATAEIAAAQANGQLWLEEIHREYANLLRKQTMTKSEEQS